jgi:CheY-specific phosphatase CheX
LGTSVNIEGRIVLDLEAQTAVKVASPLCGRRITRVRFTPAGRTVKVQEFAHVGSIDLLASHGRLTLN